MLALAQAALSTLQGHELHASAMSQQRTLFAEEAEQRERHHTAELKLAASQHKKAASLSRELNSRRYVHRMHIAHKEAVRDVWQQRNELMQTLMIVATLMFGCAYTVLVDGKVPGGASGAFLAIYYFLVSVSLTVLLACLAALIAIYSTMSTFDIHRPLKRYPGCDRAHLTFADFYECHCRRPYGWCLVFFYGGSFLTVLTCAMLFSSKAIILFSDTASCILFCCGVVPGALVPAIGALIWPGATELRAHRRESRWCHCLLRLWRPSAAANDGATEETVTGGAWGTDGAASLREYPGSPTRSEFRDGPGLSSPVARSPFRSPLPSPHLPAIALHLEDPFGQILMSEHGESGRSSAVIAAAAGDEAEQPAVVHFSDAVHEISAEVTSNMGDNAAEFSHSETTSVASSLGTPVGFGGSSFPVGRRQASLVQQLPFDDGDTSPSEMQPRIRRISSTRRR